jgi:hypothetical protein
MSALLRQMLIDTPALLLPMDETSGTTFFDRSGNARDATITGGVTLGGPWTPGAGGATFNGSTGRAACGSWTPLGSYPILIEFWIKPTTASPIGIWDTAPLTAYVGRNYPAGAIGWHDGSTGNVPAAITMTGLSTSAWNHVVIRYDYQGTTRGITYILNGVNTANGAGAIGAGLAWSSLGIGSINNGSDAHYDGKMAYFAVYAGGSGAMANAAVDAAMLARVSAHYEAGLRMGVVSG